MPLPIAVLFVYVQPSAHTKQLKILSKMSPVRHAAASTITACHLQISVSQNCSTDDDNVNNAVCDVVELSHADTVTWTPTSKRWHRTSTSTVRPVNDDQHNASIIAAPFLASAAEIHLSTSCLLSSSLASCSHALRGSPAAQKTAT